MRLLILQDYLRAGGTEHQSAVLGHRFAEQGHDTTLLTFRPGGDLALQGSGVRRLSLQPRDSGWNGWAPGLVGTVRAVQPDVVLCMGYYANLYAAWLRKRLPSVRVVGTIRTLHKLPPWLVWSWRALSLVVSNSQAGRTLLTRRFGFAPGRVAVIPNALASRADPAHAGSLRTRQRERLGAAPRTLVLLNVGMFRPGKGQAELIRIASGWSPACDRQLWLVGDGPRLNECRRLARHLPYVRFAGYQADPGPWYAGADAAVLASRMESLPNFLCESQAWGLPVVAYDVGGVRESFVPDASGWAIPYGRRDRFAQALSKIASQDAGRRLAMCTAARGWAQRFDPARQAQAYLECFRRLTGQSAAGGGIRTG
jgi:glycosyltransferase involved in cell wall biosynthesis